MSTTGCCSDTGCDGPCIDTPPTPNPDIEGVAVSVANIVATICLRILITWSPGDVDVGVQASFLQIYSILLSTLLSINRKQLSLDDASFALNLTCSPLTAYLVAASIGDLCGSKTGLYKRIKSHRRIIRFLGTLILPLWLALTMVLNFSSSAFTDSYTLGDYSFSQWHIYIKGYIMKVLRPGPFSPSINFVIIEVFIGIFLLRNWSQLKAEVRACLKSKPWGWFRLPFLSIKSVWCSIDGNHKWFLYLLFAYIDIGWAFNVMVWVFDSYVDGYILSYGQVLSVFSAIPPFLLTIEFLYSSRWDLFRFAQSFPRRFWVELVYLATGRKLDRPARNPDHLPLASISSVPREGSNGSPPEESRQAEDPISPLDKPQDVSTSQDTEEHEQVNAARVSIHDATEDVVEEGAGSSRSVSGHEHNDLDSLERPDGAGSCGYVADGTQHVDLNDGSGTLPCNSSPPLSRTYSSHGSPPEESLQAEDPTTLPDGSHDDVTGEDVPPTQFSFAYIS
ncbi:hypothetical protein BJ322DRAFT_827653 [Thelephora terrestris]|uniref:Uncharacterized protein n=1 Tax=Thelephora terrestris TaxID=56493 RepID=A0A9P6L7B2_9AGAM|nr:hypothetical protein BJ322DRAFT_827653 [Thelephora terrestris]